MTDAERKPKLISQLPLVSENTNPPRYCVVSGAARLVPSPSHADIDTLSEAWDEYAAFGSTGVVLKYTPAKWEVVDEC